MKQNVIMQHLELKHLPLNMCFIAQVSFFNFLEDTDSLWKVTDSLWAKLCVTDSLLHKLQILYDICSRFFMKQT